MEVEVIYFADLKDITGKDKEMYVLNDNSLNCLINLIYTRYSLIKDLFMNKETKNLKEIVSITINDKFIQEKDMELLHLLEGDRVAFLLPISGG